MLRELKLCPLPHAYLIVLEAAVRGSIEDAKEFRSVRQKKSLEEGTKKERDTAVREARALGRVKGRRKNDPRAHTIDRTPVFVCATKFDAEHKRRVLDEVKERTATCWVSATDKKNSREGCKTPT